MFLRYLLKVLKWGKNAKQIKYKTTPFHEKNVHANHFALLYVTLKVIFKTVSPCLQYNKKKIIMIKCNLPINDNYH